MQSDRMKRRGATIALFLAPLVLVKGAAWMLGSSAPGTVDAADAANLQVDYGPVFEAPSPPTPLQLAAASHAQALRDESFGPSPMLWLVIEEDDQPQIKPDELDIEVQGIMRTAQGLVAVVNGVMLRVGDRDGEERWEVISIDPAARSVTVREIASDREVTRAVRRPDDS